MAFISDAVTLQNRWSLKVKGQRSEGNQLHILCLQLYFTSLFLFLLYLFCSVCLSSCHSPFQQFPQILLLLTPSPLRMCFFSVLLPHIQFPTSLPAFLTLPTLFLLMFLLLLLLSRDLRSLPVPRHPELPLSSLHFSPHLQSITSSSPLGVISVYPSVSLPLSIHPSAAF